MITRLFSGFAAEPAADGPAIHVAPGGVLEIGGLTITNSMLYGWISLAVIILLLVAVARRVTVRPNGGIVQFIEIGVEFISRLVEGVFNDKAKGRKYVPYFVTLFFFLSSMTVTSVCPFLPENMLLPWSYSARSDSRVFVRLMPSGVAPRTGSSVWSDWCWASAQVPGM